MSRAAVTRTIDELAVRQHGVVSRAQLIRAGVPADVVDRRVAARRLRPLHRGVYAVGPLLAPRAAEMAALLACGDSAVVSHRSAAQLWEVVTREETALIDVSTCGGDHSRRPHVRVHRVSMLPQEHVTRMGAIPVTTITRTLCDIASLLPERDLERAVAEAFSRQLTDRVALQKFVSARTRAGPLQRLLTAEAEPALTRSEAEEHLLLLIRKAQLPPPATNARVCGYEVDLYWRAERLVVEIDGFAFHSSARRFESDRRRDATLAAAGVRVMRVTWRQLVHEPEALVARLAQTLVRARAGA